MVLCRIQGMRRAGEGGVAGYAIAADEEGGGGDDEEELQARSSRLWIERNSQLRLEPMHQADLERLEGAAAVNKLSPSDVFCVHAAEFGGGSSRDAVCGGAVPIHFFSICPTCMRAEEMEEESHQPLLLSSFMGRHLLTVVSARLLGPICNSAAWDQIAWCP